MRDISEMNREVENNTHEYMMRVQSADMRDARQSAETRGNGGPTCKYPANNFWFPERSPNVSFSFPERYFLVVSVDRFIAVVYAVESRGLRKMKHAAIVTFVIVLVVALGHLPVFIMSEGETESTYEKRCFEPALPSPLVTGFNYARFVIGFFIPLCILIVTNLNILANVRASAGLEPRHKVKVRNLALAVISSFVVCFTPYHIILLLRAVSFHFSDERCYFERTVYTPYTMSLGLSTINSAINPVFYVLTSNSVHMKIYQTLRGLRSSFRSSV